MPKKRLSEHPPVTIRKARREDNRALSRLDAQCRRRDAWSAEKYGRVLTTTQLKAAVAVRDDEVVGSLLYRVGMEAIRLVRLNVDPELRRQGIGTALFRHLRQMLFDRGLLRLETRVDERDVIAQVFLRSVGWPCIGTAPGDTPADDDQYVFQLDLHDALTAVRQEADAAARRDPKA